MTVDVIGGENPRAFRATTAEVEAPRAQWKPAWRDHVLVVHSGDEVPPSNLLRMLSELGAEPTVVRANADELPPPESIQTAILIGNGPFAPLPTPRSVARDPQRDAELDWVRCADRAGTPILGIGHGARVLASALGGGVEHAERGQRGWALVETSVPHYIPAGPWLAWQHDIIRLPPGAELLAYNRLGAQAFRVGAHLGVQFHPEATPHELATWRARNGEVLDYHDTLTATRRDPAAAEWCARRLFETFLDAL
jgi:GMP synthase-like glutamine amidotransferase